MTRAAAALAILLGIACSKPQAELKVLNSIPGFNLMDQNGEEFSSGRNLKGRVWIADFIFTTCTGPCPRMTTQMKRVADALHDLPEVRIVSITVDPDNDTPQALAAYARRYQADSRWFFLTGSRDTLHSLKRHAFLLGNIDGTLDHSTRFVLVDRLGRIRNYYATSEPDVVSAVAAGARRLAGEPN